MNSAVLSITKTKKGFCGLDTFVKGNRLGNIRSGAQFHTFLLLIGINGSKINNDGETVLINLLNDPLIDEDDKTDILQFLGVSHRIILYHRDHHPLIKEFWLSFKNYKIRLH